MTSAAAEPAPGAGGDWPHTTRVLPWALALFLFLLWLVPINAIELPIRLPVDARPDRVYLGALGLLWLAVFAAGGRYAPHWRSSPVHLVGGLFLLVAAVSLLLGYRRAALDGGELAVAIRRIALLGSYVAFFLIVVTSLRASEVPRLLRLLVCLAAVGGLGTVFESLTGTNVFYTWSAALLPVGFDVPDAPSGSVSGRAVVVGPTQHGLAITTALAMSLPFAIQFALRAHSARSRLMWLAIVVVILAGSFATLRKTGLLAPAAATAALLVYRPRDAGKVLAVAAAAVAGLALLVPDAVRSVYQQIFVHDVFATATTQGRLHDYAAIRPDVLGNVLFGRGYGTYDPLRYRILDNELLFQLVSVGVLGLLCFLGVLAAGLLTAHRAARGPVAEQRVVGIGTVGAIAAFIMTTATFDALSFVQVPYLLLFLLAVTVVVAPEPARAARPSPRRAIRETA